MQVTEKTFEELALSDPQAHWELWDGEPRMKPGMTSAHGRFPARLAHDLYDQLDWDMYDVRVNASHVRRTAKNYFIPDLMVFPTWVVAEFEGRDDVLETLNRPLLLVVEVWSPSTGNYDLNTKFAEYKRRGDKEIWRVQPYEHTLTAWRLRPDGSYAETVYHGGIVPVHSLPGVTIDLDRLLAIPGSQP